MKKILFYLCDLLTATWAWMTLWTKKDYKKLERRFQFIDDITDKERKKQLPYKIIMSVYKKRLLQLHKHKFTIPFTYIYKGELYGFLKCEYEGCNVHHDPTINPQPYRLS